MLYKVLLFTVVEFGTAIEIRSANKMVHMKRILDWLLQVLNEQPAMKESYCRIDEGQNRPMPQKQTTKLK